MSGVRRLAGLVRSLAIYHGIPFRQARLRRFHAAFLTPGDLVFDLGAHAGNRTRAFAGMGCRVVAVEPQPDFARLLRVIFARTPRVEVLELAVGAEQGRTRLSISERTPTVTTIEAGWQATRALEPDFSHVTWDRQVDVEMTTLDALIARFGVPAFIKLDVEGAEPGVLAGLSHPIRALAFEYLPRALDCARACVDRLNTLGRYEYNWSIGESYAMASDSWMNGERLLAALTTADAQRRPGDVYAKLVS